MKRVFRRGADPQKTLVPGSGPALQPTTPIRLCGRVTRAYIIITIITIFKNERHDMGTTMPA